MDLSFISHAADFDVVADVAVEHLANGKRICIVVAERGNIAGPGQHRWPVSSDVQPQKASEGVHTFFNEVGLPFLQRFSSLTEVIRVLRNEPGTARLICPLVKDFEAEATS